MDGSVNELEAVLVDHLVAHGPIGFDEYVDHPLYAPGLAFYATGGGAGRRRDFLTSPEVGPLFGAVVARALDAEGVRLGQPSPFTVLEGGAGRGALARSVRGAGPGCLAVGALRYVCVERSDRLRAE